MLVSLKGDAPGWKQLQGFKDAWDGPLAGMEKEPAIDILEALFKDKIRYCRVLSHDIGIYDRAEKGTHERSYKFLYEAVERLLQRKLSEANRADVRRTMKDGTVTKDEKRDRSRGRPRERSHAAPAEGHKGKTKSKGPKKKGRDRSKSKSPGRSTSSKGDGKKGVCYTWKNTGKCDKHDKGECNYSHDPKDKARSSTPKGGGKGKKGKKGRDKSKPRSSSHQDKKKTHCFFYLRMKCSKGDSCDFKHDPEELAKAKKDNKDFQ